MKEIVRKISLINSSSRRLSTVVSQKGGSLDNSNVIAFLKREAKIHFKRSLELLWMIYTKRGITTAKNQ
jgi:hypothetical protein